MSSRDDLRLFRGGRGVEKAHGQSVTHLLVAIVVLSVLLLGCGIVIGILAAAGRQTAALAEDLRETKETVFIWQGAAQKECARAGITLPDPDPELLRRNSNQ